MIARIESTVNPTDEDTFADPSPAFCHMAPGRSSPGWAARSRRTASTSSRS